MITAYDVLKGFSFREPDIKQADGGDGVRVYTYSGRLNKFLHQNKADIVDAIDGVLLDSYLLVTARGYMVLKEAYLNPNASNYTVYFSTDSRKIYDIWDELTDKNVIF